MCALSIGYRFGWKNQRRRDHYLSPLIDPDDDSALDDDSIQDNHKCLVGSLCLNWPAHRA